MIDINLCEHYMCEIRKAIEIEHELDEFNGWCDIASSLFASILKKHHHIEVQIISGAVETIDKRKGHYWNKWDHAIIDITADQFGYEPGIIHSDLYEDCYIEGKAIIFSNAEQIYQRYIDKIEVLS